MRARPEIAVLMLSMHSEGIWGRQVMEPGVRGCILKNAVDLDLGSAVRQAAADELALGVPLPEPHGLKHPRHCGLTPRELEILQLIVDGRSNGEIAALLNRATIR